MRTLKNIIILAILSVLAPQAAYSQSGQAPVDITDAGIARDGNFLSVGFTARTEDFSGDYGVTLVPVVYDEEGNSAVLDPVTLAGRRREISDERDGSAPAWNTVRVKDGSEYRYSSTVAWEPWMGQLSLSVYRFAEACRLSYEGAPIVAASGIEVYREPEVAPEPVVIPEKPLVTPAEDFSRNNPFLLPRSRYADVISMIRQGTRDDSGRIFFRVADAQLDKSFMDNSLTLGLVAEALRMVQKDPSVELSRIFIAGYASPEGSLSLNTSLAQRRAEAVRDYIIRELGVTDNSLFEIYNGGEDWNGLHRMVEASDMPGRDKVLYLLDNRVEGDELIKSKLKYFEGGVPYAYMLKHFFPKLRSSGYIRIFYEVVPAAGYEADGATSAGKQ